MFILVESESINGNFFAISSTSGCVLVFQAFLFRNYHVFTEHIRGTICWLHYTGTNTT